MVEKLFKCVDLLIDTCIQMVIKGFDNHSRSAFTVVESNAEVIYWKIIIVMIFKTTTIIYFSRRYHR
ncbi:MAG: hypothetical protein GX078_02810 [Clostridiales bacterium]|nr:hypothetical protein [Clostridiales bacterium]